MIQQIATAFMIALGLGLAVVLILVSYKLISLALTSRRLVARQASQERSEQKLLARLRAEGYSDSDAAAAVAETRSPE